MDKRLTFLRFTFFTNFYANILRTIFTSFTHCKFYVLYQHSPYQTALDCIRPVLAGEMFMLSVQRQEYLMKVIFDGLKSSGVGRTLIRQESVS